MSSDHSQSECGCEDVDLQHFITESNKLIAADKKEETNADRGGSLDRLKAAISKGVPESKGTSSAIKIEKTRPVSKEPAEQKPKPELGIVYGKDTSVKVSLMNLKSKLSQDSKTTPQQVVHKKARPGTAFDESTRRQTAYTNKNFGGATVLKVEGAFSKKISLYRDTAKEAQNKKPIDINDSVSDDEASVDTVKKETNHKKSPSKKKKKQKMTICLYNERSEIGLIKHFLEKGEWKKVFSPEEAVFTFVYNERNLDWGVAKNSMVHISNKD